jgi:2-oxoglutarate dehydrogenase E2 component (dihydrolipoamide succinyltransferase)
MSVEVTMPQMGESVVEGTISKWLVHEGDEVTEDQPLCEISTDKVDTEIPSPAAGVIAQIVAQEGETLPVGAVLATIEEAGAGAAVAPRAPASKPGPMTREVGAPPQAAAPDARETERVAPAPMPAAKPRPAPAAPDGAAGAAAFTADGGEHRRYSPVVLKIAAEHGIDLSRVPGTGIGGRVSKRDVMKYLESLRGGAPAQAPAPAAHPNGAAASPARPAPAKPAPPPPSTAGATFQPPVYQPREGDTVEQFSRRRKLIAEHMVFSKTHSPHVGTLAEVDLTRLMALREKHKRGFQEKEGFALTMLPMAAAATVRALKEFPRMNASVVGDSLVIRKQINLGIAMDTEEGLLVPVIKAAEGMSVVGIAREIERLRLKVQERKVTADDLSGGSFTLSNPGREGNLFGFAIINQPQVGILRMGEIKKRAMVVEVDGADALAIRTMMYLALSYDHRVIDGVLGNRFLYRVARIMEEADFEL